MSATFAPWTWAKTGDRVRITAGPHRGQLGTVQVGGGIARVALDNGLATWFDAEKLTPHRPYRAERAS